MNSLTVQLSNTVPEEPPAIIPEVETRRIRAAMQALAELTTTGRLTAIGLDNLIQIEGDEFRRHPLLRGEGGKEALVDALTLVANGEKPTVREALAQLQQNFRDAIRACREQLGNMTDPPRRRTSPPPRPLRIYREPEEESAVL